ncbi:MAG: hypothetical protein LBJ67_10265 [Planctomycetaceae bacterium]|nr:hypothetical protein [Planctomycetaceae bacterium]
MSSITILANRFSLISNTTVTAKPIQNLPMGTNTFQNNLGHLYSRYGRKNYETFTIYEPSKSGGGVWDFTTGTFKPGYSAVTFIATPGGSEAEVIAAGNRILNSIPKLPEVVTADDINTSRPGAVYENGQWTFVEDFVKNRASEIENKSSGNIT